MVLLELTSHRFFNALQPWEPQCFCSDFPHEAVCADPWGQALLVSTDAGVLLVDDDLPSVPVFDKTLPVKQMHVLETLDLLILRADKGKDARLFVFRLSAVHKAIEGKQAVRSKCDCRDNKLEKTKGDGSLHILVVSVQFFFFPSDCSDFTGNKNALGI